MGQIESRRIKLEEIYQKWEKKNFPDKKIKDQFRQTLAAELSTKENKKKGEKK